MSESDGNRERLSSRENPSSYPGRDDSAVLAAAIRSTRDIETTKGLDARPSVSAVLATAN